ncbi:MAG: alpha/beta fold hydrolase [Alphaproteobacteria bacterium]
MDRPDEAADVTSGPEWFQRALNDKPTSHHVSAMGCDIHYLRWGPRQSTLPGILFLHAGGAHAQWWSFIAPFFSAGRPVVAIDFSGMGDSGRREAYGSDVHIAEIAAVLADADLGERPIIIGHSFGGFMAMCYGHRFSADLQGIVFVDTPIRPVADAEANSTKAYTRPKPVHPDRKTILQRFRLGPAQPCENDYILDFIAGTSITPCDGGWTWKFDVAARGASHHVEPLADYVISLDCRKALIYGEESTMVTPDIRPYLLGLFTPNDPIVCIPEAHHHVYLDQPLAFVASLRAILSTWE